MSGNLDAVPADAYPVSSLSEQLWWIMAAAGRGDFQVNYDELLELKELTDITKQALELAKLSAIIALQLDGLPETIIMALITNGDGFLDPDTIPLVKEIKSNLTKYVSQWGAFPKPVERREESNLFEGLLDMSLSLYVVALDEKPTLDGITSLSSDLASLRDLQLRVLGLEKGLSEYYGVEIVAKGKTMPAHFVNKQAFVQYLDCYKLKPWQAYRDPETGEAIGDEYNVKLVVGSPNPDDRGKEDKSSKCVIC